MAAGEARSFVAWLDNIVPKSRKSVFDHSSEPFKRICKKGNWRKRLITSQFFKPHSLFSWKKEDGRAGTSEVKGRCYRSQKKSEVPHTVQLKIADREGTGNMAGEKGLCKAG